MIFLGSEKHLRCVGKWDFALKVLSGGTETAWKNVKPTFLVLG